MLSVKSTVGRFAHSFAAASIGLLLLAAFPVQAIETSALLEVYGQLPKLEEANLSPDGTKIALVGTSGEQRNLVIVDAMHGQVLGGAHVGDFKLRATQWVDNDNLLLTVSSTKALPFGFIGDQAEAFQLEIYNVTKQTLTALNFGIPGERTFNVIYSAPMVRMVDGGAQIFVRGVYLTDRVLPALFCYSVAERRMRLIAKGSRPAMSWLIDESGRIAGQFAYDDEKQQWDIFSHRHEHMDLVASGKAAIDVPAVLGFGADGDSIVVQFIENGDSIWKTLSLKDGSWGEPIEKRSVFRQAIADRKSGRIIGGVRGLNDDNYLFFDPESQAHWNAVLRAFPGERVELVSSSDGFTKIIVRVFGAKDGFAYALFDWYTHSTSVVGQIYPGAVPAEITSVSYPAADGLIIPSYLTLPPGAVKKNLPLIVMPHGGPAAADTLDFHWWAQAFAAQGYAVLQPNYRGSTLNPRFLEAGYGQWGRKMQTDLSDGVRYLAEQGIIDSKRVCIVGGSYGGYAALAGVTLESGVYRCAISVAGVADLKLLLRWTNSKAGSSNNLVQRYWDRFMGISNPGDPALDSISPIEHVGAVSSPVLLIHGRDDTVVPYEQSVVMADALKHAGKSVEMVTLKHEDHWLSRSATRQEMLEASVAFLKKNNPAE
jgi:dipeptidyl aminopeptidase/acylaminoacyl peptidase